MYVIFHVAPHHACGSLATARIPSRLIEGPVLPPRVRPSSPVRCAARCDGGGPQTGPNCMDLQYVVVGTMCHS
jgi:hypothetical protein